MHFRLPLLAVVVYLSSRAVAQTYRYHLDTISTCSSWYDNSGDYGCTEIRDTLGISPANFTRWNPSISLDCEGWELYTSYCSWVESEFPIPSTTTTKTSTTAPTATAKPSPSSWSSIGCWPVGESDFPTLDYSASTISDISPSKCGSACYSVKDTNYVFAGISSGSQCLCGDFVRNDMTDEINKKCNITCAGNTNQTCGGTGFISIYQAVFGELNETTTTTTSSTSSGTSTRVSTSTSSSVVTTKTSTTSSSTAKPTPTAAPVSSDGTCGALSPVRATCEGSAFGSCCSSSGYCGSTSAYCDAGCQTAFGTCVPSGSNTSPDGSCGGTTGYSCTGSAFGNCCSQYGYCGNTVDHCATGCQTPFGTCTGTGTGPDATVSTDGTCAGVSGYTCLGSEFGNCCSAYGWCGNTDGHCLASNDCNPDFGACS
ncbi:hypothetical protein BKA64DRAFT_760328 [Cadophora sp. MPI-SDFR-AT-0126]|nr:hypothetical protein BKA64DRAFT_760328 [Leotiomycetes sp. MPI-SDFR-AT-0126]